VLLSRRHTGFISSAVALALVPAAPAMAQAHHARAAHAKAGQTHRRHAHDVAIGHRASRLRFVTAARPAATAPTTVPTVGPGAAALPPVPADARVVAPNGSDRADGSAAHPWRTLDHVELATAEWVDWFNHRRLYEYCGDMPPAEMEAAHYAQQSTPTLVEVSN